MGHCEGRLQMAQQEMADIYIVYISCAHMNAQLSHGINKSSQKKILIISKQ